MGKYKFSLVERQSLYEAYDKKCFYCGELVYFRELQIDHIVPENLLSDIDNLNQYIQESKLADSFIINSYFNWVPTHSRCNNRKSGEVFTLVTTLYYLGLVERRMKKIQAIENAIKAKLESDILITTIVFALAENKVDFSDVKNLIANYNQENKVKFGLISELEFVDRVYRNWINQNDFDELVYLPVKTGSLDNEGVILTDPKDSKIKVNVKNCKDYFYYIDKEYYPYTNYSIKTCAFFERTCGLIQALKQATIPSFSYITDSKVSINNFELLPLKLFPSFSPDTSELIDSLPNLTFKDLIEDGNICIIEQFENGFRIEYSGQGLIMIELLRADLNNDNIEDILIYCYTYAIEGSMGFGFTEIISRLTNESKFSKI
ncbi:MAG TPA: HNH endonuclease signature motif containing protein [Paludibacter sp.]